MATRLSLAACLAALLFVKLVSLATCEEEDDPLASLQASVSRALESLRTQVQSLTENEGVTHAIQGLRSGLDELQSHFNSLAQNISQQLGNNQAS